MFESLKSLFEIFTSKSDSNISKIAFFIGIFIIILLIDITINFSYNSHLNNKLNQLEKINRIKKNYTTDSLKLKNIELIESNIINKKHYSYFINDVVVNLNKKDSIRNKKKIDKIVTKKHNRQNNRSFFLMFISSGLLIFILAMIRFFSGSGGHGTIFDTANLLFSSIGLTLILYIVPIIQKPLYNYIVNFSIQLITTIHLIKKLIKR